MTTAASCLLKMVVFQCHTTTNNFNQSTQSHADASWNSDLSCTITWNQYNKQQYSLGPRRSGGGANGGAGLTGEAWYPLHQRRQDMRHNCTIQLFKLKTWRHVKYYGDWRKQLTLNNYFTKLTRSCMDSFRTKEREVFVLHFCPS